MRKSMVSIIIVPMPMIKLIISEPVSLNPMIFLPKKYPQMNDKNMSEMKPNPKARVNLNSYFCFCS
jgi:hypothetical protein